MKATRLWLGGLFLALCAASSATAQCVAVSPVFCRPLGQAPDACGPGFYMCNPQGTMFGPNYWLVPCFPPVGGVYPGQYIPYKLTEKKKTGLAGLLPPGAPGSPQATGPLGAAYKEAPDIEAPPMPPMPPQGLAGLAPMPPQGLAGLAPTPPNPYPPPAPYLTMVPFGQPPTPPNPGYWPPNYPVPGTPAFPGTPGRPAIPSTPGYVHPPGAHPGQPPYERPELPTPPTPPCPNFAQGVPFYWYQDSTRTGNHSSYQNSGVAGFQATANDLQLVQSPAVPPYSAAPPYPPYSPYAPYAPYAPYRPGVAAPGYGHGHPGTGHPYVVGMPYPPTMPYPPAMPAPAAMPTMPSMPNPPTFRNYNVAVPAAPMQPLSFPTHPFARSPRDFFMWNEANEDELSRLRHPALIP